MLDQPYHNLDAVEERVNDRTNDQVVRRNDETSSIEYFDGRNLQSRFTMINIEKGLKD